MSTSLSLWSTSRCNLKCPFCCAKYLQNQIPNYEMSMEEVNYIIQSSKDRNIVYEMILFGGGEPTVWTHLKEATEAFYNSGVTKNITLISNGTNPEKIFEINHMLCCYAISATQCSVKQLAVFKKSGHKILYNNSPHRQLFYEPLDGVLPAICCTRKNYLGNKTNHTTYVNGKIYYCCWAPHLDEMIGGLTEDLYCNFEDDFITKFANKKYDKEICRYCYCNDKVWHKPGKRNYEKNITNEN